MSKKTLNKANLERLGAEKLADLVMDLVQGSAALQRRARMELSAAQGPQEVAADIRKRFVSLRRSTGFVDWRGQKADIWEGGHRVPFIVRYPGQANAGTTSDAIQSVVDLPQTFLDICGIPVPGTMQGVSQAAVWRGEAEIGYVHDDPDEEDQGQGIGANE